MELVRVLLTVDFSPEQLSTLQAVSERLVLHTALTRTEDGLRAALMQYPDSEILYAVSVPAAWEPDWALRWVQGHWAGLDHMRLEAIPPHVRLTTSSGVHAIVLAEHTFALLLALRRRLPRMLELQRRQVWPEQRQAEFSQVLLRGQTIGILGYGAIGREIGRLAHAFGMRVLAYKRTSSQVQKPGFHFAETGDPTGAIPTAYYGRDALADLLHASDVVVNVLPATRETVGLLDTRAFNAIKPGAIFINIGRGATVDETALIDALHNGRLAGAGLDVFTVEPLPPNSPLWQFEQVIISPHVGGMFSEYHDVCMALFRENLHRYLANEPLINEVIRDQAY